MKKLTTAGRSEPNNHMEGTNSKKLLRIDCVTSLFCLLPLVVGAAFYAQMPDRIPVHFGLDNRPDRYAGKTFALFGIPLLLLLLQLLCCGLSRLDKRGIETTPKMQILVRSIIPALSLTVEIIMVAVSLGNNPDVGKIILLLLGALFLLIGNYLPKCRQNRFLGIKLPTTLSSEENWNRTHRIAGRLWVVGGVAFLVAAFLPPIGRLILTLVTLVIMVVIPVAYSILLYRRESAAPDNAAR
ncbi:MAG: SdpI family protein [Candidatus Howiella sp.]|jgi:uncharacterized membrane protein